MNKSRKLAHFFFLCGYQLPTLLMLQKIQGNSPKRTLWTMVSNWLMCEYLIYPTINSMRSYKYDGNFSHQPPNPAFLASVNRQIRNLQENESNITAKIIKDEKAWKIHLANCTERQQGVGGWGVRGAGAGGLCWIVMSCNKLIMIISMYKLMRLS